MDLRRKISTPAVLEIYSVDYVRGMLRERFPNMPEQDIKAEVHRFFRESVQRTAELDVNIIDKMRPEILNTMFREMVKGSFQEGETDEGDTVNNQVREDQGPLETT